jgi:hypothetical protein
MSDTLYFLAAALNEGIEPAELTTLWYAADCPPPDVIEDARRQLQPTG